MKASWPIGFLILVAAGCYQPTINMSVDAMSAPEAANKTKYFLLPGNKDVTPDDLLFKEVSTYVTRALAAQGFTLAVTVDDADVAVFLWYAISGPQEHQGTMALPTYGQTGISSAYTQGTVRSYGNFGTYSGTTTFTPSYGVTGYTSVPYTLVAYARALVIDAYDVEDFKRENELKQVWRASVTSVGTEGDLRKVLPYLVTGAAPYLGKDTKKQAVTVRFRQSDKTVAAIRDGTDAETRK